MSEFLQTLLLALIPSLIVAVVTAYVTVRLSIRQFYSEKWWEKKAEAYSSIIEQLSYLQYHLEQWSGSETGAKALSREDQEKLWEEYEQVEKALKKSAAIGAYIVSDDTANALEEIIRVFDDYGIPVVFYNSWEKWLKEMDKKFIAVKDCIAKVREYAKADLHQR